MAQQIKNSFSFIGQIWCRAMHKQTRWPIHGEYECSVCFRRYRVPWEPKTAGAQPAHLKRAHENMAEAA
jgi:hypothetical protein